MSRINWSRVVLGGLVAGLVLNVFDFLVHGVWLADDWRAALEALGKPEASGATIALYVAWDFVLGIFLVWLYAAIRPRYGAGPATALRAGLAVWFAASLMRVIDEAPLGLFPARLWLITAAVGLLQLALAGLLGGWLYQEAEPGAAPAPPGV
jgi:hypothetical protein